MNTPADMRAFGASDAACYKWPSDTAEHKALRAAYLEGAADCAPNPKDNPVNLAIAKEMLLQAADIIERLRLALQKIANLIDSEGDEPLDDAIRIADNALKE